MRLQKAKGRAKKFLDFQHVLFDLGDGYTNFCYWALRTDFIREGKS